MTNYIEKIFEGKNNFSDEGLIELNSKLKSNYFIENQYNEAKTFGGKKTNSDNNFIKDNEELYEKHIIKPIVGFLNSIEGFGYLYLGISSGGPRESKFLNIEPVDKKIIKSEDILEQIIVDKLGIYPNLSDTYKLIIEKISFNSGAVFIVSIKKNKNNCIFYSRLTDNIYRRNSGSTKKLNFIESLRFIESIKSPKLSLDAIPIKNNLYNLDLNKKNKSMQFEYNFNLKNEGFEPAFHVTGIIKIKKEEGMVIKNIHHSLEKLDDLPDYYLYQFSCGMGINSTPVYPKIGLTIGKIIIESKNLSTFSCLVHIYDKKGFSDQSFDFGFKFNDKHELLQGQHNNKIEYKQYI